LSSPGADAITSLVATLIAGPSSPGLDNRAIERVQGALASGQPPDWLAPGLAADVLFAAPDHDLRALADRARAALAGAPIDVVVQRTAGRRKKLLLSDMDSTIIGQECIDELAEHAGMKRQVAAITEQAMRGEVDFELALRRRVMLLKGLPIKAVEEVIKQRIRLTAGARTLVATMRRHGAYTCLVTGGFTAFTDRVAAMIGFHESHANRLAVDGDGRLTGEVIAPVFGRDAKLATLVELRRQFHLAAIETLAAGDGANDIPMIEAAGLGVAYHAKPKVAAAAAARIDHADLTALLYAQGYRRDELVEPDDGKPTTTDR
jgi:phosphoserine phosphatase